jgi:hypothetical protein
VECLDKRNCPDSDSACGRSCNFLDQCSKGTNCRSDPFSPLCDAKKGVCVQCKGDFDCRLKLDTPVCNTVEGRCVECAGNLDCKKSPNNICDKKEKKCVECLGTGDCGKGLQCVKNKCKECFWNNDCWNNTNCEGVCMDGFCTKGKNCSFNESAPICTNNGKCVQCAVKGDCGNGLLCVDNLCQECKVNTNCWNNTNCGGQCANGTCGLGSNCSNSDLKCQMTIGECKECTVEGGLYECPSHKKYCSSSYQCVQCLETEQCRTDDNCNATCLNGVCSSSESLNCSNNLFDKLCDKDLGLCYECDTRDTCLSRDLYHCVNGFCKECLEHSECRYDESYCGSSCGKDDMCSYTGPNCTSNDQLPVCNVKTGGCAECNDHDDCFDLDPSRTFCSNNSCFECLNNLHCINNSNCGSSCVNNRCTASGLNCTAEPINRQCSIGLQKCVQCVNDYNCSNGNLCDLKDNICKECIKHSDCTSKGEFCSQPNGTCVDCLNNNHCMNNDTQCGNQCKNGECLVDNVVNCVSGGLYCDSSKISCVKCLNNDHCQSFSTKCLGGDCKFNFGLELSLVIGGASIVIIIVIILIVVVVRKNKSMYSPLENYYN